MKAVILAGGKGTRLRPYTTIFPKPLVPVGERPILDIVIQQLAYYGFDEVILTVGHLADLIQAYFHDGARSAPNMKISYVREEAPLGTAGPVAQITDLGDEPFLVMNGDVLTTLNFRDLMTYHRTHNGILTVGTYEKRHKIELGVIETDEQGRILRYVEKPEKVFPVSMGIYVYDPAVLKYIGTDAPTDFPELVRRLLDDGQEVMSYRCQDFWLDIGNQDDYLEAQAIFEEMHDQFLPGT
ncbi:MAG: nucleoside-diphosphate-sugar pyrophosphorylase [Anaerolineaceae bacterium]|nr:nucleoside-diphosphate-sugar pyrophosphorylase [Anaerolineaceae bacterium]